MAMSAAAQPPVPPCESRQRRRIVLCQRLDDGAFRALVAMTASHQVFQIGLDRLKVPQGKGQGLCSKVVPVRIWIDA